jgi:hypothetical protein
MKEFLKNLTPLQWFGIVILFNSTLLGGAGQLGDLFIPIAGVKAILAFATLGNGFLGGLVTMFGGPGNMVRTVSSFDGVEPIKINERALPSVAAAAIDPAEGKIGATTPEVRAEFITKAAS